MKKTAIILLLIGIANLSHAQGSFGENEFHINVGDTIFWQPFTKCDSLSYSIINKKVISFSITKQGEEIQIIGMQPGESTISAKCTDDAIALAQISVHKVPHVTFGHFEKPETQEFNFTYNFNPPADHYFITIANEARHFNETYMKLGNNEAYNDGQDLDRFWNIKTGKNWYYRPDSQGWTDDVDWDFEPLGMSFFPLNSFANEVDKDSLSDFYIGTEKVLDIDCWMFFVAQEDGSVIRYWVDPANGCTLKRQLNDDAPCVVTVYNLNYTKLNFGPSFKKSLYDTTR